MAIKRCDVCDVNTSAKVFFTGWGWLLISDTLRKEILIRVCKDCSRKYGLRSCGFKKGY